MLKIDVLDSVIHGIHSFIFTTAHWVWMRRQAGRDEISLLYPGAAGQLGLGPGSVALEPVLSAPSIASNKTLYSSSWQPMAWVPVLEAILETPGDLHQTWGKSSPRGLRSSGQRLWEQLFRHRRPRTPPRFISQKTLWSLVCGPRLYVLTFLVGETGCVTDVFETTIVWHRATLSSFPQANVYGTKN